MWRRFLPGIAGLGLVAAFATPPAALAQNKPSNANAQTEQYKDWDVRCPDNAKQKNACEMTQLVDNPKNGKPILRLVMGYPPQIDSAAMILILPLGTRLAPGVEVSVDNGKKHTYPFQICLKQGCRASFPVKDAMRRRMRAGSKVTVSLIGPRGNRMNLDVSLQGFTAADNRIQQ